MRFAALLLVPLVAIFLSGCAGYHVGPIPPKTMRGVTKIAVPSFRNETLEPRVEVLLANAVIKQIQQDGTYQVVDEKDADAILVGRVEEILRRPARSVRNNVLQTREFILILRVRYQVLDRSGRVLENRGVNGQTSFFVTGSNTAAADVNNDERQALPLAAEDMAVRLTSQISEGW
jgi:outer membrane lipopolysaccharide assembly protein LptE/RlpB